MELVKESSGNKKLRSNTSDSMIALNDFKILDTEIEDNNDNEIISQSIKVNNITDWSNDFNWTGNDDDDEEYLNKNLVKYNSNDDQSKNLKRPLLTSFQHNSDDLGSGYDIKSITLKTKPNNEIDDLFNDMEPVIVKTEKNIFDQLSSSLPKNNKFSIVETLKSDHDEQKQSETKTHWDSDFEIDIENNN